MPGSPHGHAGSRRASVRGYRSTRCWTSCSRWSVRHRNGCWGSRPFDEQIVGGLAMHQGKIAEMQTGEGKTLAAVAPVALNALAGHGVHVLTFNDYLARRDAAWMGPVYLCSV